MIDMFKYYDTYTRSRRISTYFSWNSIEVFDVFGAVRTGCGKSQTSRRIVELLMEAGLKVVYPMKIGTPIYMCDGRYYIEEISIKDNSTHKSILLQRYC
jgi:predicted GTPase